MTKRFPYGEFAPYYDLIYAWKDYESEAAMIKRILKVHGKSSGSAVLEVACGTGSFLKYLKEDFAVTGSDLSSAMLKEARRKIPDAKFIRADMAQINIRTEFDVILCLFSSIGYVKTYARLRQTLQSFAAHLKKGGVVLIEPWSPRSMFTTGTSHLATYDGEDIKIARLDVSVAKGNVSIVDMKFLVSETGKKAKFFEERHELAEFEQKQLLKLMRDARLPGRYIARGLAKGRGLYVGTKE